MNENAKRKILLPCTLCKTIPRQTPVYIRIEGNLVCKICYAKHFQLRSSSVNAAEKQKLNAVHSTPLSNVKHQVCGEPNNLKVGPRCNKKQEISKPSCQHIVYKVIKPTPASATPPNNPPLKNLPKNPLKVTPLQKPHLITPLKKPAKVIPVVKHVERRGPRNREEWRQMLLQDKKIIESRSLDWQIKEEKGRNEFRLVNSEPTRQYIKFQRCIPPSKKPSLSSAWKDPEVGRITQQYPPSPSNKTTSRKTSQERTPKYRVFEEYVAPEPNMYTNDMWFHDIIGAHPISRRPIYCPITDCDSMVAMPSLMAHFSCEHPRIAFLAIDPDSTRPLAVNVNAIPYDVTKCIALLLLEGRKMACKLATYQNSGASVKMANLDRYRNYLPLPLMVCRIRSKKLFQSCYIPPDVESFVDLNKVLVDNQNSVAKASRCYVSPKTKGTLSCTLSINKNSSNESIQSGNSKETKNSAPTPKPKSGKYIDSDFVFIWLCGVDNNLPINYTITAFDKVFKRHSSFRGPLHTLRETQSGWYIFHHVDCMIIHQSLAQGLSNSGARSIELEVTIDTNRNLSQVLLK